jgi:hypothetical protein
MGKIIKNKKYGMGWWARTGLVLLLTLGTSAFMNQGWYSPKQVQAATVVYNISPNSGTTVATGVVTNVAVNTDPTPAAPTPPAIVLLTTTTSTATSDRTTGSYTNNATMLESIYNTAYASTMTVSGTSFLARMRDSGGTAWVAGFQLFYVAANGSKTNFTGSVATQSIAANADQNYTVNLSGQTATVPAGSKLGIRIIHVSGATSDARIYYGSTSNSSGGAGGVLTVNQTAAITDTTPPTAGTVTIIPDISSTYTSAAPTITTVFTDAQSAVTSCQYTTNGGTNWIAGAVSGAGPYTCTANPTGLTGFLNINMRATSTGGTTTATQIQRTVDATVPTDGTLTVTAGNLQNSISWTTATDTGGGAITSYILRYATGATAPATCTSGTAVTGSPFSAAILATTHAGLTNGTQYSYRLCATDSLGNTSGGVTKSATPVAGQVTTITSCGGCHGHPAGPNLLVDANRAASAGTFQGSHTKHVSVAADCAKCHTNPTRMDHSSGAIEVAISAGGTYSKASPITISTSPTLTGGTCSSTTCHGSTSPTWGIVATCQSCHGYPPVTTAADTDNKHVAGATPVNHIGAGASVNTKATFVSAHGGCQICHGTQSSTGLGTDTVQAPHANYNVTTEHFTGNININGPTGTGTGYNSTNRGCDAACHANDATHQMTASAKTLTFGNYGTGGDCISCHTVSQPSPVAAALDATVTSRVAIAGDFTLTSSHTRSRASKTATKEDCCVCHMEGDVATGSPNGTYHKNGYVELRDPDLGTTIKAVTHSGTTAAAGAYTSTANDAKFVRFKRNLGIMLENETAVVYTGVTNFQVIGGIMVNHCLKCHDANGATSTTAQIPAASGGTAFKPFGATVAANGTNQGVLDVAGQFASTNRAFHPVLVKQNNGFTNTGGTRMVAPWNASVAKTATTTVYGPLISCWDCHAPNGSTAAITLTTTMAHGKNKTVTTDAVELRGSVYLSSTTTAGNLCLNCHVVSGGTTLHGAGSAMQASSSNGSMTYFQNRCYFCHSGVETNAHAARPIGAGDAHGYNTTSTGAAITTGGKGYAFIRRTGLGQIVKSVGATSYTATCGSGTGICNQGMGTYTPGGVF